MYPKKTIYIYTFAWKKPRNAYIYI